MGRGFGEGELRVGGTYSFYFCIIAFNNVECIPFFIEGPLDQRTDVISELR